MCVLCVCVCPTQGSTLDDMIRLGLGDHLEAIEETCVNAQKEYSLEKALERMIAEWEPVVLELKAHKDTGTHILTGTTCDEIQALLDDHIIKSQTMQASRCVRVCVCQCLCLFLAVCASA